MSRLAADLTALPLSFALFVAAILLGRMVERLRPVESRHADGDVILDYKLAGLNMIINAGAALLLVFVIGSGVVGKGPIPLRSDGWWLFPALVVYLLVHDLQLYVLHRAQHRIPMLWSMHSLHHSAEVLTVSTSARHYWLEGVLKRVFLFPATAYLFDTRTEVVTSAVAVYFLVDCCAHLNMRWSMGRFVLWINNPQFHRIHHSVRAEHMDRNFSDLLPVWDVLFGTVWRPSKDEWPATGLADGVKPADIFGGLVWPLRRQTNLQRSEG